MQSTLKSKFSGSLVAGFVGMYCQPNSTYLSLAMTTIPEIKIKCYGC